MQVGSAKRDVGWFPLDTRPRTHAPEKEVGGNREKEVSGQVRRVGPCRQAFPSCQLIQEIHPFHPTLVVVPNPLILGSEWGGEPIPLQNHATLS